MDQQLSLSGNSLQTRTRMFELMSLRVHLLGRFSDLFVMQGLVDGGSTDTSEMILAARFHVVVHEFDAADDLLTRVEDRCKDDSSTNGCATVWQQRRTLDLARHERLEFWLESSQAEVERAHSYANFFALAAVQGSLGQFEKADRSFASALESYDDVSPFALASVAFRRGVMWSESAGRPDLGDRFYREALAYLPQYVVANVHLAELVAAEDSTFARGLLEIAAESEDPEPWGKLAILLSESEPPASWAHEQRADEAYRMLLDAFPLAFADHGSEFFAGVGGDPELAVELALSNLKNRRTPRAYLVALGALAARGDQSALCRMALEARPYGAFHPVLRAEIDALADDCEL